MRPIPDAPAEGYEPAIAAIEQLVKLVRLYEIIVVPRQEHHATQGLRPVESHAAPAAGFLRGIEIGQRIPVEQFVFVVARIPVAAFGSDYLPDELFPRRGIEPDLGHIHECTARGEITYIPEGYTVPQLRVIRPGFRHLGRNVDSPGIPEIGTVRNLEPAVFHPVEDKLQLKENRVFPLQRDGNLGPVGFTHRHPALFRDRKRIRCRKEEPPVIIHDHIGAALFDMIERNPPALYPAPGDRHPVPVVENDQIGKFLWGRDRDRQFQDKVDAVEIRFRNVLYEGGSEGRRNSLRQGSPLVGQALGLETEHLAVNLPDTLLLSTHSEFQLCDWLRLAHWIM